MVLGMSLATFTLVHVIISLIAIAAGFVVLSGLLGSNRMAGMTALFLLTTILTNATGFLFPFEKLLPSHIIALLSLVLLAIACIALYGMKLSGAWRWIYVVTALLSALLQRLRAGDPELPQDSGIDGAGAGQSPGRTGVRRGPRRRAGVLYRRHHRFDQAVSPARDLRLIATIRLSGTGDQSKIARIAANVRFAEISGFSRAPSAAHNSPPIRIAPVAIIATSRA